jgi:dGTPase
MQTIHVSAGARQYPILVGHGLVGDGATLARHVTAQRLLLVSNTVVAPLYAAVIRAALPDREIVEAILPDGEQHKSLQTAGRVFDVLIANRFGRDAAILALGGGVVGDLAGFVAACYQRGIDYYQLPTTLLAHVDSSVGGKTAVNHPAAKNMIGAFHQPRAVFSDVDLLSSLPPRELRAGLAEVIKYGLICDPKFLEWLEANLDRLLHGDAQALIHAICRSCEIKAAIVGRDERESGERALLNLGHTFGHAIEAATGYTQWLHGEAVGTGMLIAADFSARMGLLRPADVERVKAVLLAAGLPVAAPQCGSSRALEYMKVDKKAKAAAMLAPYAASEAQSRGRRHPEPPPEHRGEFQRDRDRIIHCNAFRRLGYKTQVFVNHEGDLYRTRVTHSIEVAQIARSIAGALHLNENLVEAIALAHDLGHTPFGHAGQDALNECMRDHGGFEHNLQSLRVVEELEERYARFNGLNLTFECREGILKHCDLAKARQLGEIGERFLKGEQPGLEAQLANLADEIAYNNHDVDDGIRAGLISLDELRAVPLVQRHVASVDAEFPGLSDRRRVHETIRHMINEVASDVIGATGEALRGAAPRDIGDVRRQRVPLVRMSQRIGAEHQQLKQFLGEHVYRHHRVLRMTSKARRVVSDLFAAFYQDARLMPTEYRDAALRGEAEFGLAAQARIVADYIAGMTDRYAILEHRRIFDPAART